MQFARLLMPKTDKGAKHRGAEMRKFEEHMQLGLVIVYELSDLLDDSIRTFIVVLF